MALSYSFQQSFQNNSPNKCPKGLPSWLPSGNTCCSWSFSLLTVAKCLLKEDCLIIFYNICPSWACHADYPNLTYIGSFNWNVITAVYVSMHLLDDCNLNMLLWEVICHCVMWLQLASSPLLDRKPQAGSWCIAKDVRQMSFRLL